MDDLDAGWNVIGGFLCGCLALRHANGFLGVDMCPDDARLEARMQHHISRAIDEALEGKVED